MSNRPGTESKSPHPCLLKGRGSASGLHCEMGNPSPSDILQQTHVLKG